MAITTGTTPSNPCLKLQVDLGEFFGDAYPVKNTAGKGTIEALQSEANRAGTTALPTANGDGVRLTANTVRNLQLRYVTQDCTLDSPTFDPCNLPSLDTPAYKTANVTVTRNTSWGFQLNEDDYRDMCESKDKQYLDMVMVKYESAKRNMNQQAVALVKANMGDYPGTASNSVTSPESIPVVTAAGLVNPAGLALIAQYYRQMNVYKDPMIVGAGKLDMANRSLAYAGQAANGINAAGTNIANFFSDTDVNKNFSDGQDHALTWMPGAIQFVGWNDFVGQYAITTEQIRNGRREFKTQQTTMEFDGIRWDFIYEYDCGVHKFVWNKYFDIVPLPSDAFASCQDWNYNLHFLLSCGDVTCEMINDASTIPTSA
jgi:hypothetical protein